MFKHLMYLVCKLSKKYDIIGRLSKYYFEMISNMSFMAHKTMHR
jgi:hypothetical protein